MEDGGGAEQHVSTVSLVFCFGPKLWFRTWDLDQAEQLMILECIFSIPLSLLIYTFPILRIDTNIDQICDHNVPGHNGQYQQNGHNGLHDMASYGHEYDQ